MTLTLTSFSMYNDMIIMGEDPMHLRLSLFSVLSINGHYRKYVQSYRLLNLVISLCQNMIKFRCNFSGVRGDNSVKKKYSLSCCTCIEVEHCIVYLLIIAKLLILLEEYTYGKNCWNVPLMAKCFRLIWNRHGHECSRIWKLSGNFTLIQCIKKWRDFLGRDILGTTFFYGRI